MFIKFKDENDSDKTDILRIENIMFKFLILSQHIGLAISPPQRCPKQIIKPHYYEALKASAYS